MKRSTTLFIVFCLFHIGCSAQIPAVTGSGDEVTLYSNGTWKYNNKTDTQTAEIPVNKTLFKKPASATFIVKSNTLPDLSIAINPKKWDFKRSAAGETSEFTFDLRSEDAYSMIIVERIQIPLLTLRKVALENARKAAPDIEIVKSEYRTVNGRKVLFMQMEGTISDIPLTYFCYYYSFDGGSVQFLTYTSRQLAGQYKSDMEDLLNGLTVAK